MTDTFRTVAVDSTWDDSTQIASAFRRTHVHPYLATKGLKVNELTGQSADRAHATVAVKSPAITYVTGVSHGRNDAFTGDNNLPVFDTEAYPPEMFRGKIVHFLACNTAYLLGRTLVKQAEAGAFFGYVGPFAWPSDAADKSAAIFFDCDGEIDRALADGATAAEAGQRAIAKFDQQIAALRALGDANSLHTAAMLECNRDKLRSPCNGAEYGSRNATLGK